MNLPWACDVQEDLTRPNCIVMSLALASSSHGQDRLYPLEVSMEDSCLMTASRALTNHEELIQKVY